MALLLLILLSLFASPSAADPFYYICGSENFIRNSNYSSNLNHLISTLSSNALATGFATSSTGIVPDRVYGLTLCRGDTDIATCRSCISTAISNTQQLCSNKKEATIWYDYCQLRYSNQDFLFRPDVTTSVQQLFVNSQNVSADRLQRFENLNTELMGNLSALAVRNTSRLFATGEAAFTDADNIYGLVQCTLDLSVGECQTCLQHTVDFSKIYLQGGKGGRALGMWCNIRYEFYKFYNGRPMLQLPSDQSPSSPSPTNASKPNVTHPPADLSHGGSNIVRTIMLITLPLLVALVLITTACLYFRRRRSKMKIPREDNPEQLINVESLFFDLSTLEVATSNFSEHNKLGEGGFGSVYLGLLPDGREIAVKRLSTRSRQGINELKNEMILVAKLQHKNLVRLYGVCVEDQEKLLVYEYVPNKSLDTILFDPIKSKLLGWGKRYEIIEGIVRGLLYLHEDSQLKIIHRDLKASNILLDADMNPKISDFGLARLFGVDETHQMTNCVVGTYGYMSPEYLKHGHFSIKSDVFSFGVLILEIITGRSRDGFFDDELCKNLLSYVWENWNKGTILEIVDPALGKLFQNSEVIRSIQIGLLCVQDDPAQRPSMTEVLVMLNSYSMSLKAPSSPAFFVGRSSINNGPLSRDFDIHGGGTRKSSRKFMSMSPNQVSISELESR
ncbi:hypothetical protein IEQ34_011987 [Dendrobium chrysotoxum]|uniref:Cysteine-rich receptor-like protein kinase n=1 Tax=Dendrobium chrysotoxum TaxID=161865 RepID=A0AAV7GTW3_DENCH|nr:hypothetical protein IEQ34_011987 [Dendrobium chrysotoxum]